MMETVHIADNDNSEPKHLGKYLSPLSAWALSFGCAVGWGAFVMPGTTFLPKAGPLGTALGIFIGAVVMAVIGMNYHYLMNKYPQSGGTLTYSIRTFGYDHGYLSAWFLFLVYIAIIWANASALALIVRNLFGGIFQFGFHYKILEYDIYLGEILLTLATILIFGFICMKNKRASVFIQVLMALVLLVCIIVCFIAVSGRYPTINIAPAYSPTGGSHFRQVFAIVALSPWAYVGFESVSNSTEGFRFSVKKSILIMTAALICSVIAYSMLAVMASSVVPEGYSDWSEYISDVGSLSGSASLPTFYAVNMSMGKAGILVLGLAAIAGIITGLIGNSIAASRLLYAMSEEKILPEWFGRLNTDGVPENALKFLMGISVFIPFLGRTAIGWIVDVNTVGATIAYGYTSAAAFVNAKKDSNRKIMATGITGVVTSVLFFLYFMSFSSGTMATESYLILATWSILGFVYFRFMFSRDKDRHFGKSTIVWIGLLFLIFFTSLMWVHKATEDMTRQVIDNISEYYESKTTIDDPRVIADTENYLEEQLEMSEKLQTRNSVIQMCLIIISLGIMFSIYTTMARRERQMELDKVKAEESNRAKSTFLSNMSHDIRTPMNAIVGYVNLAERDFEDHNLVMGYISKIKTSSQHLLALINDVLEMSRIESGRMDLELIPVDLCKTMEEIRDMFSTQMEQKKISFHVDTYNVKNKDVMCDKNRLNRVLLNLISNAWKFTPEGGNISLKLWELEREDDNVGFELRVADSGIGMSKEFASKVFEAFEREKNSTVDKIQGTGLGMAITKSIIDLMGGTIDVVTAPGRGTEFIIKLKFEKAEATDSLVDISSEIISDDEGSIDFSNMRLLLAEDMEINRELAVMQLNGLGFDVETATNGREAVDKIIVSAPGYYVAVLMDIQMPVLDGYEATKEIRALDNRELAEIPIIAMTANAFSEDVKKAHDCGMNAHIAKPIDVNIMSNVLKAVLSGKVRNLI